MNEIAVRAVQLDSIDPGALRPLGTRHERFGQARQVCFTQSGRWTFVDELRNRRRADRCPAPLVERQELTALPRHCARPLAPRVSELNNHSRLFGRCQSTSAMKLVRERRLGPVVPEP